MGVMACDRNGCDKIMCDFYSSEHGYLCYECHEELLNMQNTSIKKFMRSSKKNKQNSVAWAEYVKTIFQVEDE